MLACHKVCVVFLYRVAACSRAFWINSLPCLLTFAGYYDEDRKRAGMNDGGTNEERLARGGLPVKICANPVRQHRWLFALFSCLMFAARTSGSPAIDSPRPGARSSYYGNGGKRISRVYESLASDAAASCARNRSGKWLPNICGGQSRIIADRVFVEPTSVPRRGRARVESASIETLASRTCVVCRVVMVRGDKCLGAVINSSGTEKAKQE